MPKGILMTVTNCTDPKRDTEFNRWYSHTHLPDLSRANGFVEARRFRNLDPGAAGGYMAIYEFDSPDLRESYKDLLRLAQDAFQRGRHIDCIAGTRRGGLWQEIDPSDHAPLERLDYPRTPPEEIRRHIEAGLSS
jgi:hypothetical protein